MDGWNVALLAGAAYVAVTVLVRFMVARRNALLAELREQVAVEQKKKKREAQKKAEREAA